MLYLPVDITSSLSRWHIYNCRHKVYTSNLQTAMKLIVYAVHIWRHLWLGLACVCIGMRLKQKKKVWKDALMCCLWQQSSWLCTALIYYFYHIFFFPVMLYVRQVSEMHWHFLHVHSTQEQAILYACTLVTFLVHGRLDSCRQTNRAWKTEHLFFFFLLYWC